MSELKPCPFCGGEAEEMHGHPRYIECKNCGATSGYAGGANREASVKIWNTRQPDNSDKPCITWTIAHDPITWGDNHE